MHLTRIMLAITAAALTAGCTTTGSVSTLGPDTYTVTAQAAPAAGGEPRARELVLAKANAHCAALDRQILVQNVKTWWQGMPPRGNAETTFRCLPVGDNELTRPNYAPAPNVIIEDRRK